MNIEEKIKKGKELRTKCKTLSQMKKFYRENPEYGYTKQDLEEMLKNKKFSNNLWEEDNNGKEKQNIFWT